MIRIAIASLALSVVAGAQVKLFGGSDEPRAATTKFALDEGQGFKMLGSICIQYGQPEWKADYDKKIEQAKGMSHRLGRNFWTTLNTSTATTIGGINVAAGAYYLGVHCDDKGNFHLVVLDAKTADSKAWTPWGTDEWKPTYTCPLKHATTKTTVEKLTIALNGETASALELKIAWGGHELAAPVTLSTGTAANAKDASGKSEKAKTDAPETKKAPETVKK